ncbi:MAG TPA: flavin reductase family protein [Candidatus Acidoferrales bacterium]|jgi:flavin reductase (DIM6/NTAB) family NADH-FMN oxidoreductase RutF|nr:flavin reductase family protein [Candidatus Acidoferrales bacterium]
MAISSLNPVMFRRVTGAFTTGVTVITAERAPGLVHGMTANSFTSVSLDPLLILVCVDHDARLLSFLKSQRRFGVSILREDQQALSEYFAKAEQTPEEDARLGVRYMWTSSGVPLLGNTLAQLACNVVGEHPAGDHTIFIGEVESMECHDGEPLLFHRGQYRRLAP